MADTACSGVIVPAKMPETLSYITEPVAGGSGLVVVQLYVLRLGHFCLEKDQIGIGQSGLTALHYQDPEAGLRSLDLGFSLSQVFNKIDGFWRDVSTDHEAVAGAHRIKRVPGAALDSREGKPPQILNDAQLVACENLYAIFSPLTHQLHCGFSGPHREFLMDIGRVQESILEGISCD